MSRYTNCDVINTRDYYSALKISQILIHVITRMNLNNPTNCVSPFILNSRKCKLIHSNRNEIRDYLGRGRRMTKGMEESFEGDRYDNDFDCGDNIMIHQNLPSCAL